MRLYYTNAAKFQAIQNVAQKSIGGFVSRSVVPNNFLSNLFSEISVNTIAQNLKEVKCVALLNEFPEDLTNVKIWFTSPEGAQAKVELGAVAAALNDCKEAYFEQLENMRQEPYYADLALRESKATAITIPVLKSGEYVGIWLRRSIVKENTSKTIEDLLNDFKEGVEQPTEETHILNITWGAESEPDPEPEPEVIP